MIIQHFFSFILIAALINGEDPPSAPPPPPAEPVADTSFWSTLFSPTSSTPSAADTLPDANNVLQDAEKTAEQAGSTITDTVSQYTDAALDYTGDLVKNASLSVVEAGKEAASTAVKDGAALISEPGSQVDPNKSFLEQAASYVNLPDNVDADPNTIFGLYDALSKLVTPTPDGGVTLNMPTSGVMEQIKPWTDPYCDIGPLITAFKGYEAYQKAKNTVGDVKDKVQGAAGDVKDGVVDTANKVKDFGDDAVDAVKDIFSE